MEKQSLEVAGQSLDNLLHHCGTRTLLQSGDHHHKRFCGGVKSLVNRPCKRLDELQHHVLQRCLHARRELAKDLAHVDAV